MEKNTFIFDMDGVIIDSEPLWRQAQIETLLKYNITISISDCIKYTMGKRIEEVALIWCRLHKLTINPKILETSIINLVINLIQTKGEAKKGLYTLLDFLAANNYNIALATSSSLPVINAVFNRLSIAKYFKVVCSADNEVYGKPHPAIYINTAKKLGVNIANCFVLEDSITGLIAAKAASMHTFVIPENNLDPRFSLADHLFSSMLEVQNYLENY
ncbi:hexitol phosphatase HxpB [Lutibacter sp. A80]|uniref:hexitol phosphatase HxpB n=1 Tax=Lutibacter sp. A80 TaxID=2918453 RepID=UPI001F06A057|nr:hexitol phosphatase HxpB [Lutibacter sp. A80]UMB61215.1 hexitol phosphatase HxpB [Lutibacter sp. A80]